MTDEPSQLSKKPIVNTGDRFSDCDLVFCCCSKTGSGRCGLVRIDQGWTETVSGWSSVSFQWAEAVLFLCALLLPGAWGAKPASRYDLQL